MTVAEEYRLRRRFVRSANRSWVDSDSCNSLESWSFTMSALGTLRIPTSVYTFFLIALDT